MLPNREGLFHAYPVEVGVDETGPNKLATCTIRFCLFEESAQGEWTDCAAENFEILGYFYLEKKDGSLNSMAIDALKAALGWDGRDPFWLQETDLSEHPVQIKLAFEEYNGQTRLKVQFLNPYGSTGGGVSRADETGKRSINTRLGAKLRAVAGGTPAPAAKPSGKPTPPAPRQTPPKTSKAPALAESTMDEAWDEFCKHCQGEKWTQETVEAEWFRILAKFFPGKQPNDLSGVNWAKMRDEGPGDIIPF